MKHLPPSLPSRLATLVGATLAAAALASCAQPAPPAPAPASAAPPPAASASAPDSQRLADDLRALVGAAACNADADCRAVAVGAKACGGPTGYLAWSTTQTDAQQLADLVRRQAEAARRENAARRQMSTCSFEANPGATCVQGHCQLTARPAAPGAR